MYPGIDGFLQTRASLMVDIVFVAMFAVLPVLAWSIYQVKYCSRYTLHKRVQLALGAVLLLAVGLFEIDIKFISLWEQRAQPSPYYSTWVYYSLYIHLFFAIPTALLWIFVIVQAWRKFPVPPMPGVHSQSHKFWAWLAAVEMFMTALTGWVFSWFAFAA